MKNTLLLFFFTVFFCTTHVNAQETNYTIHTIAKGETLSQLAKKYHCSVGDIMRLNNMSSKSQLKIGEKVKIPASTASTQKTSEAKVSSKTNTTADTAILIHYVWKNETVYSISKKFGVSVEQLKEWNNLPDEHIHFGQQLAVRPEGVKFLAAGKNEKTNITENTGTSAPSNGVITKKEINSDSSKSISSSPNNPDANISNDNDAGYFQKDFVSEQNKSLKSLVGYATIFKTTNGWKDKKYYIFMNGVPLGSVVKVSTPNGNSIYAKVLWTLDTTLNYGFNFRINDAAASALAVNEQTFSLKVEYHQ